MSVTFRTSGPWGAGKGSNLQPGEVDANFWELLSRLTYIEENPIPGVGVADITLSGTMLMFHMSDGSTFGPVGIPIASFKWRGEWAPATSYQAWDVFVVLGDGQYLVVDDYESPTEFDPEASDTSGNLLVKMFSVPDQAKIDIVDVTPVGGTYNLNLSDAGKYLRVNDECNVVVGNNSLTPIPVGTVFTFRRNTPDDVVFTPDAGVTISSPETMFMRKQGSVATLIKVGIDEWDLSGDLELISEAT